MTTDEDYVFRIRQLEDRHDRLQSLLEVVLFSTDPGKPGLALRVDRIERGINAIKWISSTGLIGMLGSLALLWNIGKLLSQANGGG